VNPGTHVDVDELADEHEGLVPPERSAQIAAHLSSCSDCQQVRRRLDDVTARLAAAPPEPMPTPVADRVDAALLAARGTPATVVPIGPGPRRGVTLAGLGAVAAVAAFVAAVLVSHSARHVPTGAGSAASGGPSGSTTLAVTPAQTQRLMAVERASGTAYTKASLLPTVSRRLSGSTTAGAMAPAAGVQNSPDAGSSAASSAPSASHAPAGSATPSSALSAGAVPAALRPLAANPTRLASCIEQLVQKPLQPALVDFAHFAGKPAAVIVLPEDPGHDIAWVVGADCGQPGAEGDFRFYQEVPKPGTS
jgi:hypothetical protein